MVTAAIEMLLSSGVLALRETQAQLTGSDEGLVSVGVDRERSQLELVGR